MPTIRKIAKEGALLLWIGVLLLAGAAQAGQTVGTVANLSGVLTVRKADGSTRILAQKSAVEVGDTLISTAHVYASIRLTDDSDLLLRPATRLQITEFAYDESSPDGNHATLILTEGGIRLTPGLPGLRGDQHVVVRTPNGDIAAGNATFTAQYMPPSQKSGAAAYGPAVTYARLVRTQRSPLLLRVQNVPSSSGLNPGLYVQVLDGMINVSNGGGTQNFAAGQFGFTPSFTQPPVILPANPGLQFTPPPSFSSSSQTTQNGSKPGTVDCIVR